MFAVHVSLEVEPSAEAEFLAAMTANATASLREELGCLRFELVRDDAAPSRFWLDERYVDEEAFATHRETPHFRRWQEAAGGRLLTARATHTGRVAASPGAGEAVVTRSTEAQVIDRGAGVRTIHLTSPGSHPPQFLNGITEFAAGTGLPLHWHNCDESVVVLEGTATATVAGADHVLAAGDAIRVPAELPHRFANSTPGVLRILWTYGRGNPTRTLAENGETYAVGQEPRQDA